MDRMIDAIERLSARPPGRPCDLRAGRESVGFFIGA
jgi:hypothetical protein